MKFTPELAFNGGRVRRWIMTPKHCWRCISSPNYPARAFPITAKMRPAGGLQRTDGRHSQRGMMWLLEVDGAVVRYGQCV